MINQKEIALAFGIGLIIPSTGRADVSCKAPRTARAAALSVRLTRPSFFASRAEAEMFLPSKTRSTIWISSIRTAPPPQRLILPKTLSAWLWFLRPTMVITTGLSSRRISRRRQLGQTRSSAATTLWSKAPRRVGD